MDTNHTVLIRGRSVWDKELMPARDFEERVAKVRSMMVALGLDALLVYGDAYSYGHMCYVSGYLPKTRDAMAVVPREGQVALLASSGPRDMPFTRTLTWVEEVRSATQIASATVECLKGFGLAESILGLVSVEQQMAAADYRALREALPGARFAEATYLLEDMRIAKSQRELEVIRAAARIARETMAFARDRLRPGMTECGLLAEVERFARRSGVEDFRFLIAPATNAAYGLGPAGERMIEENNTYLIYLAASYLRYWAGIGRTISLNGQSGLVDVVTGAQRRIMNDLRKGIVVGSAIAGARELLSKAGVQTAAEAYGFGGGIGLDANERPVLSANERATIASGMVLSVRVGSYKVGEGGALVSDVVAVTESGCQVLTQ